MGKTRTLEELLALDRAGAYAATRTQVIAGDHVAAYMAGCARTRELVVRDMQHGAKAFRRAAAREMNFPDVAVSFAAAADLLDQLAQRAMAGGYYDPEDGLGRPS